MYNGGKAVLEIFHETATENGIKAGGGIIIWLQR